MAAAGPRPAAHAVRIVTAAAPNRAASAPRGALRAACVAAAALALAAALAASAAGGAGRRRGGDALLSWSNFADDGSGVLGGQQHGVSEIITSCDADDPACTFQTSKDGYAKGQWVTTLNSKNDRRMEVHVRSDLRQGSSYEDDIGEGPLAGMHKTDEKGKFHEWTPRPARFREREYSRVKVGVADADGMDSWEHWRKAHPDRKGHGNLALHPYKLPTTPPDVVFRGPLNQPREVAPVDQNYDMTEINVPAPEQEAPEPAGPAAVPAVKTEVESGAGVAAAPQEIVRDGIVYVAAAAVPGGPVLPKSAPAAVPVPMSSPQAIPAGTKDLNLLRALHKVVEEISSSEAEYSALKHQMNVLQTSSDELKSKTSASQARLKNFASEEARILRALQEGDAEVDCDPCHHKPVPAVPAAVPVSPPSAPTPVSVVPVAVSEPPSEAEPSAVRAEEPTAEGGGDQGEEQATKYTVTLKLGFSMPLSDFDDAKQDACARAVAAAAGVDADKVAITGVEEAAEDFAAKRRLLADTIAVEISIEEPDADEADAAVAQLSGERVNAELAKEDMPTAIVVEAAKVVVMSDEDKAEPEDDAPPTEEEPAEAPAQESEEKAPAEETPEERGAEAEKGIEDAVGNVANFFEGEPRPKIQAPEPVAAPATDEPSDEADAGAVSEASANATAADTAGDAGLKPGFVSKYYEFGNEGPDFLPNLDVLSPNMQGTSLVIMFDSSDSFKEVDDNMPDDHFAASWTGKIRIETAGDYMFSTASDDGSYLWIGGELVVDNGGLHGTEEKRGNITLEEGYHDLKVEFFERDGGAACMVKYGGPDTGGDLQPVTGFHADEEPEVDYAPMRALGDADGLLPGFNGEYFFFGDQSVKVAPNLQVIEPSLSAVTDEINFETDDDFKALGESFPNDRVAARWQGLVKIDTPGNYNFSTTSDDGSFLWIDENLVVNNGGLHGPEKQSGTVDLDAGYHAIRVEFFENDGGAMCKVTYTGPDTDATEMLVPAWHQAPVDE